MVNNGKKATLSDNITRLIAIEFSLKLWNREWLVSLGRKLFFLFKWNVLQTRYHIRLHFYFFMGQGKFISCSPVRRD